MTQELPERPRGDIPEEDWVEQNVETYPIVESEFAAAAGARVSDELEANEADVAEQQIGAYTDDDDR